MPKMAESHAFVVSTYRLFGVVIIANLNSFSMGASLSWTSPIAPRIPEFHEDSPLEESLGSTATGWVFTLITIGAGFSGYVAGRLEEQYGRKFTLLIASIMFASAYVLLVFSFHVVGLLYVGRFMQGIGSGFTLAVVPIYVAEMSSKKHRGSTGSLITLFMTSGALSVLVVAQFVTYSLVQVVCLIVPVTYIIVYTYLPESPYYLIMMGQRSEAQNSLKALCKRNCQYVEEEVKRLQVLMEKEKIQTPATFKHITNNRHNRKAVIIVVGLMVFQHCSGVYLMSMTGQCLLVYSGDIQRPTRVAICIGFVQVMFSVVVQFVVDIFDRRLLLKISAIGMALCHFIIGLYHYMELNGLNENKPTSVHLIPFATFFMFHMLFRLGFAPLPFVMCGEMFPPYVKTLAVSVVTITWWTSGFIVIYMYPYVSEKIMYVPFISFGIFCMVAYVFVKFVVIETHDLSLEEIQEKLAADKP